MSKGKEPATSTDDSVSDRSSYSGDHISGSTSATSLTVTPEASIKGRKHPSQKRTRLSNELVPESGDSIDHDRALAEKLQFEEYDMPPAKKRKTQFDDEADIDEDSDSDHVPPVKAEEVSDSEAENFSRKIKFEDEEEDVEETILSAAARRKLAYEDESSEDDYPLVHRSRKSRFTRPSSTRPSDAVKHESKIRNSATNPKPRAFKGDISSESELSDLAMPDADDADSDDASVYAGSAVEASDGESEDEDFNTPPAASIPPPIAAPVVPPSNPLPADAADARTGGRSRHRGRRERRGRRRRGHANLQDYTAEELDELMSSGLGRKDRERRKLEKAHPGIKTMWQDLEAVPVIKPVPAAQPASINRQLKSFQLEGLDWMVKQEKTQYKGGLLGDEMGMGKTIQAVSLIMSDYPAKDPTLVLVPPVALMQWSNEIKEYTDGKLNVLVYHGQNAKTKGMKVKDLRKYDVIMISYNSLESIYRKQVKGWSRGEDTVKEASAIHACHFHRLILDEAHSIKSRTTGVAKACFALKSTYKWCLSGTPVQNRIGEFFSLLRFLEVRPFADYFCKRCPCAMLHWDVDKEHRCTSCKHSSIEHVSVFNQELLNPLTQGETSEDRSAAMAKLHMITARIMLRRMKRDHVSSMELPPKEVIIHNEFFGEIERDFSSSIMSNTTRKFDTYVSSGVMLNNYANIFGLIMQMRQVANHPDLLLKRHAHEGHNVLVCHICDEPAEDAIRSKCKHDFCRVCAKGFVQSGEEEQVDLDCPRCHIPLSIDLDQPEIEQDVEAVQKNSIINRINMANWTSSTKIEMLVYDLWKLRSKKQTLKSIIFSQFTSMLQLVEWRLRRAGFNTVMLDGSMTPIQRQRSIDHFMNTPECEIFLVSLKAGGVALNLTEASRVFIIDPWWNPAAEWQSADRCHRIGQKRPCVITRLCIEDSVESRIVMLQEKKANMISGTINNDKVAMEKLTPEDMQFLFRGS